CRRGRRLVLGARPGRWRQQPVPWRTGLAHRDPERQRGGTRIRLLRFPRRCQRLPAFGIPPHCLSGARRRGLQSGRLHARQGACRRLGRQSRHCHAEAGDAPHRPCPGPTGRRCGTVDRMAGPYGAIEDADTLAAFVADRSGELDPALAAWEASRRPRVAAVARRGAFNHFAWQAWGPIALARNLVLKTRPPEKLAADLDWLYGW